MKTGSQNDLNMEQEEENNSDSEFQIVTKKQRKKKVNDANPKRTRTHRNPRRSPRRKSTSSVPPSERSDNSDLDSVRSLPVGGAPAVSYADIAAGNTGFFTSKAMGDMSTLNGKQPEKVESASAVKTNEIEKWCDSVSQHLEKTKVNNNINVNINNKNNSTSNGIGNNHSNKNNSVNTNNNTYNNNNSYTSSINVNHTNISNNSDLKNYSRHDNRKQNLDVELNENCDNNVKKFKDLVIVDKSVDSEVATANKMFETPKYDYKKVASNCDLDQSKLYDSKGNENKKNWSKKNFSREDFPSLPVKSESVNNSQKNKETSEQNAFAKTKLYSSLPDSEKQGEDGKSDLNVTKIQNKPKLEEEMKHRRSNRSKSVGPNTRPPVILLHDEKTKDSSVCEITFGFEVNEQLLTSDDSNQVLEEEGEGMDEMPSLGSKNSFKARKDFKNCGGESGEIPSGVDLNINGGIVYNSEVVENQNAYLNSSKVIRDDVNNATYQESYMRHENTAMGKVIPSDSHSSSESANSIAKKYVPPVAPVQFNYDKIVTYVGMGEFVYFIYTLIPYKRCCRYNLY